MTEIEVFLSYASAFEVAYATDDWSGVREWFTEDAVYEVDGGPPLGGIWHGRDAVVDHLIDSVNSFDRCYDQRLVEGISAPTMRGGAVCIDWAVTYRKAGEPDLRVEGQEEAWIRDGKIARLKDTMP